MSNIDPLVPAFGNPTTAAVRANFAAAKEEIETLQNLHGFFNYADLATQTTPIAVAADTWVKLTNDAAGAATHSRPGVGVTALWDEVANEFDFSELPLDSVMDGRFDLEVTTSAINQVVDLSAFIALGSASETEFPLISSIQFKAAGTYKLNAFNSLFLLNNDMKNNPTELRIHSDASLTVKVGSFFVRYVLTV